MYNAYTTRVGYALSTGQSGAHAALYIPMRDIWSGGPEAEHAGAEFDRICRAMLERQVDFDLIDDDVLDREATRVDAGAVVVGKMRYSSVVIPPCRWMPEASRARLAALAASGGRVLALEAMPGAPLPDGSMRGDLADLDTFPDRCVSTDHPAPWMRAIARETGSGRLVFITNEDPTGHSCRITIPSSARPLRLDPVTGAVTRIAWITRAEGGWAMDLGLPFAGSVLLWCPAGSPRAAADPGKPGQAIRAIDGPWTLRPAASVELTGTEVRWAQHADAAAKPVQLGEWSSILGEAYSGHAVYEAEFACTADEARRAEWLDLGEVKYAATVEVNGHAAGSISWAPWAVPVKGLIKAGANHLSVTVSNTMANQYLKTKALDRWTANQLGPYHPRALQFEPDSLPSGLWGPVVLRAGRR